MNRIQRGLFFSSLKISVATLIGRLLGLGRELAMATLFGASGVTDAFLVAYRIPNMLRDLFAEGVFSSVFVPIFTQVKQRGGHDDARRLLWSLFITLGLTTALISLGMAVFAPQLIRLFAPKFAQDPEIFSLTVTHVRIMSPYLVLVSLAALFMGALNTLKIFFTPALTPAFFNIVMIASILFLPSYLEGLDLGLHPSLAMAIGVIGGGLLQMLLQIPLLVAKGFGPIHPSRLVLANKSTKMLAQRLGIGFIGMAAAQINLLITTIIATSTVVGAVSWLTYAFRLFQFPLGIMGVSIANSHLAHFSDAWKAGNRTKACQLLSASYHFSLLVLTPALALLLALAPEAVHVIFERGAFKAQDTSMTTMALQCYLFGLPFYGLTKIFTPTFYALDRPRVPVVVSAISIVLNIAFCLFFTPRYGFHMLALGMALSMAVNSTIQSEIVRRHLGLSLTFFLNLRLLKFLLAGTVCYLATHALASRHFDWDLGLAPKIFQLIGIAFIGVTVYAIFLLAFGEGTLLKGLVRLRKKG